MPRESHRQQRYCVVMYKTGKEANRARDWQYPVCPPPGRCGDQVRQIPYH